MSGEFYWWASKSPGTLREREIEVSYAAPTITKKDREFGSVERYFVQQANQASGEIIEVSKQTFERVKRSPFYRAVQLTWRISGKLADERPVSQSLHGPAISYTGVITSNRVAVEEADRLLPGMRYVLRNFTQYWSDG